MITFYLCLRHSRMIQRHCGRLQFRNWENSCYFNVYTMCNGGVFSWNVTASAFLYKYFSEVMFNGCCVELRCVYALYKRIEFCSCSSNCM